MLLLFGILTIKEFLTYRDLRRLHMKIAVCDDDIAELNNICEILNNYFEEKKIRSLYFKIRKQCRTCLYYTKRKIRHIYS